MITMIILLNVLFVVFFLSEKLLNCKNVGEEFKVVCDDKCFNNTILCDGEADCANGTDEDKEMCSECTSLQLYVDSMNQLIFYLITLR